MKRTILIFAFLLVFSTVATAQTANSEVAGEGHIRNLRYAKSGDYLTVDCDIDLTKVHVPSNRAILLTPGMVKGNDSVTMQSVAIFGRTRYFYYLRNDRKLLDGSETSYRAGEQPESVPCHAVLPYQPWMNDAKFLLNRRDYGCCHSIVADTTEYLPGYYERPPYYPHLRYVRPQAVDKGVRSLEGSAFINFPVDKTNIYPDYMNNPDELMKIRHTIDSVRNDKDVTLTSIWLKGYASPESPYAHNTDLARGRVAALKEYVRQLYHFDYDLIETDYEPENWAGLRDYVVESAIDHKEEILKLIDGDLDPDNKEWKIKRTYPKEYRFLLTSCYPSLRRTDYRISYKVTTITDINRIKELIKTEPGKLSLNELFLAAQTYEVGSEEFNEVFDIAVRLFPNDPVANLNAANTEMQRGNLELAAQFLRKADDSAEAVYARGALAFLQKDYDTATKLMTAAKEAGIAEAQDTLDEIALIR